jgi:hypothetical protein
MHNDLHEKNVRSDRLLMVLSFLKGYDADSFWMMEDGEKRDWRIQLFCLKR